MVHENVHEVKMGSGPSIAQVADCNVPLLPGVILKLTLISLLSTSGVLSLKVIRNGVGAKERREAWSW